MYYLTLFFKFILPYGLYTYIHSKRNPNYFINAYNEYLNNGFVEEKQRMIHLETNYKSIVSVQGLGYSGSGAILDLLCEMNNCEVVGTVKKTKTLGIDHNGSFEFDFLRLSGGLFEFEKYIDSYNYFQNDAFVNRLISYLNEFSLFKFDRNVQYLFCDFINKMTHHQIMGIKGVPYNYHLNPLKKSSDIFFLKHLSIVEYRETCKIFLEKLFSYLNINNKSIVILDQLLSDFTFDLNKYNDYLPGFKLILSYRDPRDVYTLACEHNIGWISHRNVNSFIDWYKMMTLNINLNTTDYLVVQFEKLITDYDNQVRRIMNYLDISQGEHDDVLKKTYFDPRKSIVNVGLWKSNKNSEDIELIYNSLKEYCFD